MTGYSKLFSFIVSDSVWLASDETRLVWVTLLAMADRSGFVDASLPGVAHLSHVSIEECEKAIAWLKAPDGYGRFTEHEGRRILPLDGGWQILHFDKYKAIKNNDERREYLKIKQRESRAKKKLSQALP